MQETFEAEIAQLQNMQRTLDKMVADAAAFEVFELLLLKAELASRGLQKALEEVGYDPKVSQDMACKAWRDSCSALERLRLTLSVAHRFDPARAARTIH